MKIVNKILIHLDKPNQNGRIYKREVVESALQHFGSKPVPIQRDLEPNGVPRLANTLGSAKLAIKGGDLVAECSLLVADKISAGLEDGTLSVVPCGTGKLLQDGTVTDYEINYLAVTPDPAT